jgi:D-hexose-6-phosphate mutarotase
MAASMESLHRFEIAGVTRFVAGPGGLIRLEITSRLATAHIYLHGAHITHFQPVGSSPVIYLSPTSRFAHDKAIRGGVPIIFPWFGPRLDNPSLPMHGFARTSEWELETVEQWPDQTCQATLRLVSDDATRALWPHDFVLRLRVTVGRKLQMALEIENWSGAPFTYEEALHTYLAIRDIRQTRVTGLHQVEYLDKVDGFKRKRQDAPDVRFEGETDRVYLSTDSICSVDDPTSGRVLLVAKDGSQTTVVWNPWEEKASALADLGSDVWPRFVCVESANASENAVTLQHGESHVMRVTISVE